MQPLEPRLKAVTVNLFWGVFVLCLSSLFPFTFPSFSLRGRKHANHVQLEGLGRGTSELVARIHFFTKH